MNPEWFSIVIHSRPAAGEPVAANTWQLAWHETTCRLAVIGAPDEGLAGANAAATVIDALAREPKLDPARAVAHGQRAGNDGGPAALVVARIDAPARSLTIAGTGAIGASLYQNGACHELIDERGIAGGALGPVRQIDIAIGDDWLLLVRVGGPSAVTDLRSILAAERGPRAIARSIRNEWGIPGPGATLLLAGPR